MFILLFCISCEGGVIPALKITKDFGKQTTLLNNKSCRRRSNQKDTVLERVTVAKRLEEITTSRLSERCHPMSSHIDKPI